MSRNEDEIQDNENSRLDNDMEDWMNTWQQIEPTAELINIREAFASTQWRRRVKDVVTLVILIGAAAVSVTTLASPEFFSVGLLAVFGLFVASGLTWKRYQRMKRERLSIPLSPTEYVKTSKHNLSLLERENRFIRWIFPVLIPLVMAANIWIAYDLYHVYEMSGGSVGLVIAVTAVLLGYACWKAYIKKPAELRRERDALTQLENDLRGE